MEQVAPVGEFDLTCVVVIDLQFGKNKEELVS